MFNMNYKGSDWKLTLLIQKDQVETDLTDPNSMIHASHLVYTRGKKIHSRHDAMNIHFY